MILVLPKVRRPSVGRLCYEVHIFIIIVLAWRLDHDNHH